MHRARKALCKLAAARATPQTWRSGGLARRSLRFEVVTREECAHVDGTRATNTASCDQRGCLEQGQSSRTARCPPCGTGSTRRLQHDSSPQRAPHSDRDPNCNRLQSELMSLMMSPPAPGISAFPESDSDLCVPLSLLLPTGLCCDPADTSQKVSLRN